MPAASCLFGLLQLRGGVGALGAQTVSDLLQLPASHGADGRGDSAQQREGIQLHQLPDVGGGRSISGIMRKQSNRLSS